MKVENEFTPVSLNPKFNYAGNKGIADSSNDYYETLKKQTSQYTAPDQKINQTRRYLQFQIDSNNIDYEEAVEVAKKLGYSNLGLYPYEALPTNSTRLSQDMLDETTRLTASQFATFNDYLHQSGEGMARDYLKNVEQNDRNAFTRENTYLNEDLKRRGTTSLLQYYICLLYTSILDFTIM